LRSESAGARSGERGEDVLGPRNGSPAGDGAAAEVRGAGAVRRAAASSRADRRGAQGLGGKAEGGSPSTGTASHPDERVALGEARTHVRAGTGSAKPLRWRFSPVSWRPSPC